MAFEIKRKPVLIVAHGSVGGAQAVAHLRGVIPGLGAISIPPAVMMVGWVSAMIDEDGNLASELESEPRGPLVALTGALAELKWFSDALAAAKNKE